jgi:hypothetical protein
MLADILRYSIPSQWIRDSLLQYLSAKVKGKDCGFWANAWENEGIFHFVDK